VRRLSSLLSPKATVAVFAAAVVAVIAEIVRNAIAGAAAISTSIVSILMLLALLLVFAQLDALRKSVDQLSRKAGFSITYYPAGDEQKVNALHLAAKQVIERAPDNAEIYAVNSYVEVFRESNDPSAEQSQRDYLRSYETRFGKLSKYHRMIQVKDGRSGEHEPNLGDRLAPAYLAHYRAMAEYAEHHRSPKIRLWRVPAVLPTSFVVVKNGKGGEIIWQMNHQQPSNSDSERMEGIFIVSDPDGLLVDNFIHWSETLEAGERNPVETTHLRTSDAGP
jgi:hypothetical protein